MSSEVAKTIATAIIWGATAAIFIFGLFGMRGDFLFFIMPTAMICLTAVLGTAFVWLSKGSRPAGNNAPDFKR